MTFRKNKSTAHAGPVAWKAPSGLASRRRGGKPARRLLPTGAKALIGCLAVLVAIAAPLSHMAYGQTGTTGNIDAGLRHYWGSGLTSSSSVGLHTVDGEWAYCMEGYVSFNSGVAVSAEDPVATGRLSQDCVTDCALAWKYVWDEDRFVAPDGGKLTSDYERYAATQVLVWGITHSYGSMPMGHSSMSVNGRDITGEGISGASKSCSDAYAWIRANRDDWIGHAKYWNSANSQDVASTFTLEPKTGGLSFAKASDNETLTKGNDSYSLKGALYGVFESREKAQARKSDAALATYRTDEKGAFETPSRFKANTTYYIAEITPSKGHALDETVYPVTVKSGQTTAANDGKPTSEPVKYEKIGLVCRKVDATTGKAVSSGAASLADARFQVRFYAGQHDASNLPDKPTRTWTLKTDADGKAFLDEAHKVSGDDFYTDASGSVVVPLGTVSVIETKAPAGYLFGKPELHVVNIEDDGKADKVVVDCFEPFTVIEHLKRGNLDLVKSDATTAGLAQGDAKLAGAQFDVVNDNDVSVISPATGKNVKPGGVVCTITTDETGHASTTNAALNGWKIPDGKPGATDWFTAEDDWEGRALPFGSYRVVERSASAGYAVNTTWSGDFTINEDGKRPSVSCPEVVKRGNVELLKRDDALAGAGAQGSATLAGAVYDIVNASGKAVASPQFAGSVIAPGDVVCSIVTDDEGFASTTRADLNGWSVPDGWEGKALAFGSYLIRERTSGEGYAVNVDWEGTATIAEDGALEHVETVERILRGNVELIKVDAQTASGQPQGDATLAGAVFDIVNMSGKAVVSPQSGLDVAPGDVVCSIVTDEEGFASTTRADLNGWSVPDGWEGKALAYGEYDVVERTAPQGYLPSITFHGLASIDRDGKTDKFACGEEVIRGSVTVGKIDRQNTSYTPQGKADLAGAVFEVVNASARSVVVDGTEYDSGAVVATMQTVLDDEGHYTAALDDEALPFGTYIVRESASSPGYLYDDASQAWSRTFTVREHASRIDLTSTQDAASNKVKRGDFSFSKIRESSMARLGAVAFLVTSKTTGEAHVVMTDENGMTSTAASWNPHTAKTNANDEALITADDQADATGSLAFAGAGHGVGEKADAPEIDASKLDAEAGVWFDGSREVPAEPDDSCGALPYDSYTVRELRSAANDGLELVEFDIEISRDSRELDLGTVSDKDKPEEPDEPGEPEEPEEPEEPRLPSIATTLNGADGGHVVPADDQVTLVDTVDYLNLEPGTYTLHGELHRLSEDGSDGGVIATTRETFVNDETAGSAQASFSLDCSQLGDSTLVATETLLDENGDVVATHADLLDENQTVRVPAIETSLTDSATESHEISGSQTVRIVDEVSFEGLEPLRPYTLTLTLHAKDEAGADAGEVVDARGNPVTAQQHFTPTTPAGTVEVVATFEPPSELPVEMVAFEELTSNGKSYALHAQIDNESQTVRKPRLATSATDAANGNRIGNPNKPLAIIDAVSCSGIEAGADYEIQGELHVRDENGKDAGVLLDTRGNPVVTGVAFAAAQSEQTVNVPFEADVQDLQGKTVVVFERLLRNGVALAEHADPADDSQAVSYPAIATQARDALTGTHTEAESPGTRIIDTVSYEGLVAGQTYELSATLHVRAADGSDAGPLENADGTPARGQTTFTPESPTGTVEVVTQCDRELEPGTDAVVFEELRARGNVVAAHADIDDEGQTISKPAKLETSAVSSATGTQTVERSDKAEIVDTVRYANLEPERAYVLTATMHVRDAEGGDGGVLKVGGQAVTKTIEFTPAAPDGTVEVPLTLDTNKLEAGTLVAFEQLASDNGTPVAEHADISDEGQTIRLAKIGTKATDKKTSTHEGVLEKDSALIDTVSFDGLSPQVEYELEGTLYDKKTGKPATDAQGDAITAHATFSPSQQQGEVQLEFQIDEAKSTETTFVAFERIEDHKGNLIASHEDINSKDQSVSYAKPPSKTTFDKTGWDTRVLIALAALVPIGLACAAVAARRDRRSR